jgi:hypothetical protein
MSVYTLGISAIERLVDLVHAVPLHDEVLITLLVYTDEKCQWISPDARRRASSILEQQFNAAGITKEQFITDVILQRYLRPVFSGSRPASITASGRKAEYTDSAATRGESIPDDTALTKPWKYTDRRAIPALAWAVREADVSFLSGFKFPITHHRGGVSLVYYATHKTNPNAFPRRRPEPTHCHTLAVIHPCPAHPG